MKPLLPEMPLFYAPDRETWRNWLIENHQTAKGVWLVYYNKQSGYPRVAYDAAVEEALCFGWIDSVIKTLDADRAVQLFSPRKPKSNWSRLNKQRVDALLEADSMTEAGLKMVNLAKQTGTWDALNEVENLSVPPDLQAELGKNAEAQRNWNGFSRSARRGILEWILNAKRPETRQARVEKTANMAARGLKALFDKE